MHAVARGETGSGANDDWVLAGVVAGATFVVLTGLGETPCGFVSSFFHMGHLDVENWIFEAAYRRAGWELRLGMVKIVQDLAAVNKNGG